MFVKVKIADLSIGSIYRRRENDHNSTSQNFMWQKLDDRQHRTVVYNSIAEEWQYGGPGTWENFNPHEVVTVSR